MAQRRETSESRSLEEYRDELKAMLAARRELGRESEDVLIADFLRRIEREIDARVEARLPRSRRARSGGRQLAQIGIAVASLVFAVPLSAIAGEFAGLLGLIIIWAVLLAINLINILRS